MPDEPVTLDTTAVVEVQLVLQIPNNAEFYASHEVDTLDHEQIENAVRDELASWWANLGVRARVEAAQTVITERTESAG